MVMTLDIFSKMSYKSDVAIDAVHNASVELPRFFSSTRSHAVTANNELLDFFVF